MSSAIFYRWRAKYGGMDASLMKQTKELEDENRRPKKMCAKERLFSKSAKKSLRGSGTAISEARDGEESVD